MKRVSLFVVMLLTVAMAWAQQKSVTLTEAGTLATLLPEGERSSVTNLKVSGPLNGSDILVLREMGKSHLAELDMSEATIVKGGACYFPVGTDQNAYTVDDRFTTRFFYGCGALRSVTIPNSVTFVSNDAFMNCPNLTELKVANSEYFTAVDGILFNADMDRLVRCPQAKKLETYEVPRGVIEIYPGAFRDVKTLHSVTLPASIWSISSYSFSGCPLKTIRCFMTRASIDLAFDQTTISTAKVIVPKGTASDFKSVEGWNKFKNIVEE
ncbi:MAG: leucine-rich repeat domain-containing protein [Prevotella sp.]|nr:leucine-rich repeat domain-containing protein [Prevotella sp.]